MQLTSSRLIDLDLIVDTFDDVMRFAAPGTEGHVCRNGNELLGAACALLNYGLLHEDLFFETNGEFFGVWELLNPVVAEARKRFGDQSFLGHLEKVAKRYEAWQERRSPGHIANMRPFMQQMRAQAAAARK